MRPFQPRQQALAQKGGPRAGPLEASLPSASCKGEAKISSSRGMARICHLTVPGGVCAHLPPGTSHSRPAVGPRKGMSCGQSRSHPFPEPCPQVVKGKGHSGRSPGTATPRAPGLFRFSPEAVLGLGAEVRREAPKPPPRMPALGCDPPASPRDHSLPGSFSKSSQMQEPALGAPRVVIWEEPVLYSWVQNSQRDPRTAKKGLL